MGDAYALHTDACTYLLDDEGVCRRVRAPRGDPPDDATAALGAQFVACLDLETEGGLVGDLRVGAAALFVREQEGRFLLLRTTPIRRVDDGDAAYVPPEPPTIRIPPRPPRPRGRGDAEDTLTLVRPMLKRLTPPPPPPRVVPPPPPPRPSRRNETLKKRK